MGSESGVPASIFSETAAVVSGIHVEAGELIAAGQLLLTTELMKMRQEIRAPSAGVVFEIFVSEGAVIDAGAALLTFIPAAVRRPMRPVSRRARWSPEQAQPLPISDRGRQPWRMRPARRRGQAAPRRDADRAGKRCRPRRRRELPRIYGALALAAQRRKYRPDDLKARSPADGVHHGDRHRERSGRARLTGSPAP